MRFRIVQSYGRYGATVTPYGRPTLKIGDKGPDVADLQEMLNAAIGTSLAMDGVFGPATGHAVIQFQTQQHLPPDGIVGTTTWTALGQPASGKEQVPVVGTTTTPKPGTVTMAPGAGVLGFFSDPVNLAAVVVGGGLIAYFAFRGK